MTKLVRGKCGQDMDFRGIAVYKWGTRAEPTARERKNPGWED
jgi:hypothetical protein